MPEGEPVKVENSLAKTNWVAFGLIFVFVLALVGLLGFLYINSQKQSNKEQTDKSSEAKVIREGEVKVTSDGFEPQIIKVSKGTKVTWVNEDDQVHQVASDPHPTHTNLKNLDSGEMEKGITYSFTFNDKGSFTYHDHINPLKFSAEVVVE